MFMNQRIRSLLTIIISAGLSLLAPFGANAAGKAETRRNDSSLSAAGKADDGILKIFAIGNSFSVDALEQEFHAICEAAGKDVIVGNMYIGGCSIERHVGNIADDIADYSYRKIGTDGSRTVTEGATLARMIHDEDWDIITVQQASHDSGMPETYAKLGELVEWIHSQCPDAVIMFHQTWAYAKNSDHWGFARYGNDQKRMYKSIMHTVRTQMRRNGINAVIPSGTAIQNARRTKLGDDLTRDGFHLDYRIGRYIASATWFEAVTGMSVVGNSYVPENATAEEVGIAQRAAHSAIRRPFRVSMN